MTKIIYFFNTKNDALLFIKLPTLKYLSIPSLCTTELNETPPLLTLFVNALPLQQKTQ